jgi:chorismate mutase
MPVGHSRQHGSTEETTRNSTLTAQHGVLEYNAVKFGRTLTFKRNFLPSSSVQEIYLENGVGRCIRNTVTYVSKYTASRPGSVPLTTAVCKLRYHKNGSHLAQTC